MKTNDNHSTSSIDQCRVLTLNRHFHARGSLTAVQNDDDLPFAIRRVFYIYDVPSDSERGGHSHFELHQLIVAASGSFSVEITDGVNTREVVLNRPYQALYVPPGVWNVVKGFSSGSICLVLTSDVFDEDDYVRDYNRFLDLTANKRP